MRKKRKKDHHVTEKNFSSVALSAARLCKYTPRNSQYLLIDFNLHISITQCFSTWYCGGRTRFVKSEIPPIVVLARLKPSFLAGAPSLLYPQDDSFKAQWNALLHPYCLPSIPRDAMLNDASLVCPTAPRQLIYQLLQSLSLPTLFIYY
jgi:hypothetical protein